MIRGVGAINATAGASVVININDPVVQLQSLIWTFHNIHPAPEEKTPSGVPGSKLIRNVIFPFDIECIFAYYQ